MSSYDDKNKNKFTIKDKKSTLSRITKKSSYNNVEEIIEDAESIHTSNENSQINSEIIKSINPNDLSNHTQNQQDISNKTITNGIKQIQKNEKLNKILDKAAKEAEQIVNNYASNNSINKNNQIFFFNFENENHWKYLKSAANKSLGNLADEATPFFPKADEETKTNIKNGFNGNYYSNSNYASSNVSNEAIINNPSHKFKIKKIDIENLKFLTTKNSSNKKGMEQQETLNASPEEYKDKNNKSKPSIAQDFQSKGNIQIENKYSNPPTFKGNLEDRDTQENLLLQISDESYNNAFKCNNKNSNENSNNKNDININKKIENLNQYSHKGLESIDKGCNIPVLCNDKNNNLQLRTDCQPNCLDDFNILNAKSFNGKSKIISKRINNVTHGKLADYKNINSCMLASNAEENIDMKGNTINKIDKRIFINHVNNNNLFDYTCISNEYKLDKTFRKTEKLTSTCNANNETDRRYYNTFSHIGFRSQNPKITINSGDNLKFDSKKYLNNNFDHEKKYNHNNSNSINSSLSILRLLNSINRNRYTQRNWNTSELARFPKKARIPRIHKDNCLGKQHREALGINRVLLDLQEAENNFFEEKFQALDVIKSDLKNKSGIISIYEKINLALKKEIENLNHKISVNKQSNLEWMRKLEEFNAKINILEDQRVALSHESEQHKALAEELKFKNEILENKNKSLEESKNKIKMAHGQYEKNLLQLKADIKAKEQYYKTKLAEANDLLIEKIKAQEEKFEISNKKNYQLIKTLEADNFELRSQNQRLTQKAAYELEQGLNLKINYPSTTLTKLGVEELLKLKEKNLIGISLNDQISSLTAELEKMNYLNQENEKYIQYLIQEKNKTDQVFQGYLSKIKQLGEENAQLKGYLSKLNSNPNNNWISNFNINNNNQSEADTIANLLVISERKRSSPGKMSYAENHFSDNNLVSNFNLALAEMPENLSEIEKKEKENFEKSDLFFSNGFSQVQPNFPNNNIKNNNLLKLLISSTSDNKLYKSVNNQNKIINNNPKNDSKGFNHYIINNLEDMYHFSSRSTYNGNTIAGEKFQDKILDKLEKQLKVKFKMLIINSLINKYSSSMMHWKKKKKQEKNYNKNLMLAKRLKLTSLQVMKKN